MLGGVALESYWHASAEPLGAPALSRDATADVVIVGGGFAGLGAAYAALRQGLSAVLLERAEIGSGASGRNAGFLLRGAALSHAELSDRLGRDAAEQMLRWSLENRSRLTDLAREAGVDAQLRNCGSLLLCADAEEEAEQMRSKELLEPLGLALQPVDPEGLPRALAHRYRSGFFVPDDGELHPVRWLRGIAGWLMRQGLRVHERSEVLALEGTTAVARGGRARGGALVLALNGYAGGLCADLEPMARPVRGQVLVTEPVGRLWYVPTYARHGYEYYRQTADGRLLVGGWRDVAPEEETGRELVLHEGIQARIDRFLRDVAPGARVERRWSGIMGFSPDHLPVLRRPAPRTAAIGGFSGHGVSLAFRLGELAAQAALGGEAPPLLVGEGRAI